MLLRSDALSEVRYAAFKPFELNWLAIKTACFFDTQKPNERTWWMSLRYLSQLRRISLTRRWSSLYMRSSSSISYRPRRHETFEISTWSLMPKYWNGHNKPRFKASGNRISAEMLCPNTAQYRCRRGARVWRLIPTIFWARSYSVVFDTN